MWGRSCETMDRFQLQGLSIEIRMSPSDLFRQLSADLWALFLLWSARAACGAWDRLKMSMDWIRTERFPARSWWQGMKREVRVKFSLALDKLLQTSCPTPCRPAADLLLSGSPAPVKNQQRSEPRSSLMGAERQHVWTLSRSLSVSSSWVSWRQLWRLFLCVAIVLQHCTPDRTLLLWEVLNHLPVGDFKAHSSDLKGSD